MWAALGRDWSRGQRLDELDDIQCIYVRYRSAKVGKLSAYRGYKQVAYNWSTSPKISLLTNDLLNL